MPEVLRPLYESSAVLAQKTTVAVRTFTQIDSIPCARLENTIGILVTLYILLAGTTLPQADCTGGFTD